MVLFLRQVWTLTAKNLRIVFLRKLFSATIRALVIPLILLCFFSYAKYLFVPAAVYGVGSSRSLLSFSDALQHAAESGRHRVVFYNGGFQGGPIDSVIDQLVATVESAGSTAIRIDNSTALYDTCRSSLRGVTKCYGAVLFDSSPSEGPDGYWRYAMRSDGGLGQGKINIDKHTNDGEVYTLPFQRAIDEAIVAEQQKNNADTTTANAFDGLDIHEYPFTSMTTKERNDRIRERYQSSITGFLGVAFISGVIGICYHLTGFVATEREIGMATLVDAMMTTSVSGRRWGEAQIARLLSYHLAFTILYLPGWVIGSAVVARSVFAHSNAAAVILYHALIGITLASMSIMGSSLFRRSQLSGVSVTIVYLLLAILAQTITAPSTGAVIVLSLLFAPCNYVFYMTNIARFEKHAKPVDLLAVAPRSPWHVPGIVLIVFLIIQNIAYPIIGIFLERYLHGTTTTGRTIVTRATDEDEQAIPALQLEQFSKTYSPGPLRRAFGWVKKAPGEVRAVRELTLTAGRGQILVLLGANGSGKSTTLDSIAGTSKLTSGRIVIDGTGGLGIAPQKNVMWDELTVEEHIAIFNRLKAPHNPATADERRQLIAAIDLDLKAKARSKTLSGGQKRKLQLGMMLTGGSAVCCVDEVSSGLDPLSRRKIWDILLAERGHRTMIMTTHFLDEADLLADHIAVLSKGTLRAEGSSVMLKDQLGGGYRIHVPKSKTSKQANNVTVHTAQDLPDVAGVHKKDTFDIVDYIAPSSSLAAKAIRSLEAVGITDYRFSGPTLEDVFLQLAEEVQVSEGEKNEKSENEKTENDTSEASLTEVASDASNSPKKIAHAKVGSLESVGKEGTTTTTSLHGEDSKCCLQLMSGRRIGYWQQAKVLFLKRFTVFKGNWFVSFAAFVIPIIAAGLVTLFVQHQKAVGCSPEEQSTNDQPESLSEFADSLFFVAGPRSKLSDTNALLSLFLPMFNSSTTMTGASGGSALVKVLQNFTLADTFDDFNNLVVQYRKNITPAAFWLGDDTSPPTLAYYSNYIDNVYALYGFNFLDVILSNMTIAAEYASFDTPWSPDMGKSLQLLVYVSLACAAYPGFFSLYPNLERRRHVRGLEYSNGVRVLPLWMAYVAFDFAIVLVSSAIVTILFAALSSVWFHVGYLFLIFALYGLASALLAYFVSLFCGSQLAAYAFTAAIQAVAFLVYMIAYLCTITYAPVNHIDADLLVVHFVVSAFAPIGSVVRSLFVSLNLFSVSCDGNALSSHPGDITLYGGPILYLILQTMVLFGLLLWFDSGNVAATLHQIGRRLRGRASTAAVNGTTVEEVLVEEVLEDDNDNNDNNDNNDTNNNKNGLQVQHITKTFKRNTAVDNVSFRVRHGEVFALLGPNGAGKSTTISMIRGDLKADDGDVLVEGQSITKQLTAARSGLGVCPQFDAVDQMTVVEHLRFYAAIRGIAASVLPHQVDAVVTAVGLDQFRDRQAHALSGGNKRKLSLGIALMGNPSVVLLDEPSSGLDAAAKRVMWRTLAGAAAPGRAVLLTTHSMEEADALAGRAGILARRMLAMGDTDALRARFGSRLFVHVVCRGAPHTPVALTDALRHWVVSTLVGAEVEDKTYHGQMRFAVPTSSSTVGRLVVLLDEQRDVLGIEHFSVSPTTLDQVFLAIVGRHNVQEEGYHRELEEKKKKRYRCW